MDRLTKEERSLNMSKIKSKDTLPEIRIRKALWRMGYRYRLHYKLLPGKPDIVITKQKIVIFVHAVFGTGMRIGVDLSSRKIFLLIYY
jgi:DNA mismatch endonuclease (patch repair protein)